MIGEDFYPHSFGIMIQNRIAHLANNISEEILRLRENGFMEAELEKWIGLVCSLCFFSWARAEFSWREGMLWVFVTLLRKADAETWVSFVFS